MYFGAFLQIAVTISKLVEFLPKDIHQTMFEIFKFDI